MRLVLFDVDNTLLWTGGAGTIAMARAFHDLYGIEDAFRSVEFSGRTDNSIVREAMALHSVLDGDVQDQIDRFKERYLVHLADTLQEATGGRVLPGVCDLLRSLGQQADVRLGLATGNFRGGAELKLGHYGFSSVLVRGGFGDDAEERASVVSVAIERVGGSGFGGPSAVIGDTPHDVRAAKANRAFAVGVATGRYSAGELQEAGADAVFEDCADPRLLDTILSL